MPIFPPGIKGLKLFRVPAVFSNVDVLDAQRTMHRVPGTVLLMHMDSSAFPDVCGNVVSNYGGITLNTTNKKFGAGSAYSNGNFKYLYVPPSPQLNFGAGPFTIDCWIRRDIVSNARTICAYGDNVIMAYRLMLNSSHKVVIALNVNGSKKEIISSSTITDATTWHHIAATRSGDTLYLFQDGALVGSVVLDAGYTIDVPTNPFVIGANGQLSDGNFYGYIDEFRIVKGAALWTTNFTPPSSPGDQL